MHLKLLAILAGVLGVLLLNSERESNEQDVNENGSDGSSDNGSSKPDTVHKTTSKRNVNKVTKSESKPQSDSKIIEGIEKRILQNVS